MLSKCLVLVESIVNKDDFYRGGENIAIANISRGRLARLEQYDTAMYGPFYSDETIAETGVYHNYFL